MNGNKFTTHVITGLLCLSIGVAATERFITAKMGTIIDQARAESATAQKQLRAANETIDLLTAKSTVLYESSPVGVDVIHGLARVQLGHELYGVGQGTVLMQKKPVWVIPFAIRPMVVAGNEGASYAYVDKLSGQVSQQIAAPKFNAGGGN